MGPIQPIQPGSTALPTTEIAKPQATDAKSTPSFEQLLASANQDQNLSDVAVQELVTGQNDDIQQVVMQVVKADMSFQLFLEVRNKVIESYNELMRMQF
ncbi:MAG: flagellar hook-basal body complex protein FliE [Planctomycetota bacterium]